MFKTFDMETKTALMELDAYDLKHCAKMTKHFQNLGINPKHSGNALKTLAQNGLIEKLYQQA